ncbi:hypothetical protein N806_29780 [Rhodococcus sp. P27]|nr:hypothetical protein N806_29780 [Rhodococcus sp. P27]
MTTATLIASTQIDRDALGAIGYETHRTPGLEDPGFGSFGDQETDADELAEFAGRNCYQSFGRPNPKTATNAGYLEHILDVGHESVLEHGSASFYIQASRSVLTELERHRHLSFSVVSQRYVDVGKLGVHIPPGYLAALTHPDLTELDKEILMEATTKSLNQAHDSYNSIVEIMTKLGFERKKAREAARAVVPNCIDSPMVVTGNHRAWRYVIKARWHEAADAEIRELAGQLLEQLRTVAPNVYQDIPDTPYSY